MKGTKYLTINGKLYDISDELTEIITGTGTSFLVDDEHLSKMVQAKSLNTSEVKE